jgi:hypothetical protein
MSFQFPEQSIPPSTSPSGRTYPAILVARETVDIPTALDSVSAERAARRITVRVLDRFWGDIERTCSAPFLQLMDVGGYNDRARENRERINAERKRAAADLNRKAA